MKGVAATVVERASVACASSGNQICMFAAAVFLLAHLLVPFTGLSLLVQQASRIAVDIVLLLCNTCPRAMHDKQASCMCP